MHRFPQKSQLDLATNFGMLLVKCSQTPGRISNLSLNNLFPTRSRALGFGIWCRLALLEREFTFWMRFFSFGGTTQCTGADMFYSGDRYVQSGGGFIHFGGIHRFGGSAFLLVAFRPFWWPSSIWQWILPFWWSINREPFLN